MLWMTWNVLAAPVVVGSQVSEGRLAERLLTDSSDVVLLYGGEQKGRQDPCGCLDDPRGSLGRVEAYAAAVRDTGVPTLLLNAGNWLADPVGDNGLREDAYIANRLMLEAMEAGTWDARNTTFRDLPYLGTRAIPKGAISANARGLDDLPAYTVFPVGAHRVAVTGVTVWGKAYLQPEAVERLDPLEALAAVLPAMHAEADLVVVMAYGLGTDVKALTTLDIDVLIEADGLNARFDPVVESDTIWVRSNDQTQFLGELRLTVKDGGVVSAFDRAIDMDADIPWPRSWRRRHKLADREVRAAQTLLFPNH